MMTDQHDKPMKNQPVPPEGQSSEQTTSESPSCDAACSPRWVYHYCAVSQPRKLGETCYTDGIATLPKPIITWEDYMSMKAVIVSKFEHPISPEKLTITSITLLENDERTRGANNH